MVAAGVAVGVKSALSNRSSTVSSGDIGAAACAGATAAVAAAAINYCSSSTESTEEEKEVLAAPYFTPYEVTSNLTTKNNLYGGFYLFVFCGTS